MPAALTARAAVPDSLDPISTLNATVLDASGGALASAVLNAPIVDWWQGSGANPTVPGAPGALLGRHLRLFGRNLAWVGGACLPFTKQASGSIAPTVTVTAVAHSTGEVVSLPVTFASCYRVDVLVPAAGGPLIAGTVYQVRLGSGLAGPGVGADGRVTVIPTVIFGVDAWPVATFTVGAGGTPGCGTIADCLQVAGAAGGGTVLAGAGAFNEVGPWRFPDGVALRGAGRGRTVVTWRANVSLPVTFNPRDSNTCGGLPVVAGVPNARWRMSDMDLVGHASGGHGYQPYFGTDFVALGYSNAVNAGSGGSGGSSARLERLNITFDLRVTPGIQLGNAFAAYGAADFSLADSYVAHRGSCSAQWPHNCAAHVTNSTNGELRGVTFDMGCQSISVQSSSRVFMADCVMNEVRVWEGTAIGSANGGFEFSTIDPPHVSESHYLGNSTYTGDPGAFERWESFTTDGPADSFFNETALSQRANADGTATLALSGPIVPGPWFFYANPGDAVAVIQGPGVGQMRRLVAVLGPENTSVVVSAPFDPPLSPSEDILSITGYRGGYTFEGNTFRNGTCFQMYGQVYDAVVSGNSFDEMFSAFEVPSLPSAAGIAMGSGLGGGGRVYDGGYQMEAYNVWEHNTMRCAHAFLLTMGNLDKPVPDPLTRPNATFNFAQTVRRNAWLGLDAGAALRFTHEHVVEGNAVGAASCAYAGGAVIATNVSMGSASNVGLLYRPGPQV